MSSAPHPTYAPDPPSRFRWVPPLFLGIALGGLIGCVATFAILELGKRSTSGSLAERFNHSVVLDAVPGHETVTCNEQTTYLGQQFNPDPGRRTAIRRRYRFGGVLPMDVDPNTFAKELKKQIDAEFNRLGANTSGHYSSGTSCPDELRVEEETTYYTRDGREGHYDLYLQFNKQAVSGILIILEGR